MHLQHHWLLQQHKNRSLRSSPQALFSGSIISVISVYIIIILLGVFDERATVQP